MTRQLSAPTGSPGLRLAAHPRRTPNHHPPPSPGCARRGTDRPGPSKPLVSTPSARRGIDADHPQKAPGAPRTGSSGSPSGRHQVPAARRADDPGAATGGFLTAVEFNDQRGSGGRVRFRHYPSLSALHVGRFDRNHTAPHTLSRCNEGTPSIRSVSLAPDIDHSVVEVAFHCHRNCDVGRQAVGRLTDFADWAATADSAADDALIAAAGAVGQRVLGNIGDRDSEVFAGITYSLFEIQPTKGDFGSWRVYLRDGGSGEVSYLPIITHGGSTAFANPTLTTITAPSGRPAVVATMFIPTEDGRRARQATTQNSPQNHVARLELLQDSEHIGVGKQSLRGERPAGR